MTGQHPEESVGPVEAGTRRTRSLLQRVAAVGGSPLREWASAAAGRLAGGLRAENLRHERLAAVARRLSGAADLDTVVDIIVSEVGPVVGADVTDVGLLLEADHVSMNQRGTAPDPDLMARYYRVPLTAHLPTTDAIRQRRIVLIEDLEEYERDHRELLADVRAAGLSSAAAVPLVDASGDPFGVLGLAWRRPVDLTDARRSMIETLGELCGQTLRRTQVTMAAHQLASLAADLATATTPQEVARHLVDHGTAALGAAHVNLRIVDPLATTLESLLPIALPSELGPLHQHIPLDAQIPLTDAFRQDRQIWLEDMDDYAAQYPEAASHAQMMGYASTAAIPLHASDGSPIAVIGIAWRNPLHLDRVIRSTASTIADVTAQTLERTRLHAAQEHRAAHLGRLAQRLAATVTRMGVAEAVAELAPVLLSSRYAVMSVPDDGRRSLTGLALAHLAPDLADHYRSLPLGRNDPTVAAFTRNRVLTFPDPASLRTGHPGLATDIGTASAYSPLRDADGHIIAVLSVGWDRPVSFDASLRAQLATIGDLVGQTLERSDLYEREHAIVAALQRRLLLPPTTVEGLDIAAHYQPATKAVGMCGDWYDTIVLDGGLVVIVGDVSGHGVEAVAAMAQLKYVIAGLIRAGAPLPAIFAQATAMLAHEDGIFATAQLLHIEPGRHRVGCLNAGHPWALLRRPDGTVTPLKEASQPLIGMPLEPEPLAYADFPPGSLLMAYTDGLVERRGEFITESIDHLARLVADVAPGTAAEPLLHRLVAAARRPRDGFRTVDDDIAAVLIRHV